MNLSILLIFLFLTTSFFVYSSVGVRSGATGVMCSISRDKAKIFLLEEYEYIQKYKKFTNRVELSDKSIWNDLEENISYENKELFYQIFNYRNKVGNYSDWTVFDEDDLQTRKKSWLGLFNDIYENNESLLTSKDEAFFNYIGNNIVPRINNYIEYDHYDEVQLEPNCILAPISFIEDGVVFKYRYRNSNSLKISNLTKSLTEVHETIELFLLDNVSHMIFTTLTRDIIRYFIEGNIKKLNESFDRIRRKIKYKKEDKKLFSNISGLYKKISVGDNCSEYEFHIFANDSNYVRYQINHKNKPGQYISMNLIKKSANLSSYYDLSIWEIMKGQNKGFFHYLIDGKIFNDNNKLFFKSIFPYKRRLEILKNSDLESNTSYICLYEKIKINNIERNLYFINKILNQSMFSRVFKLNY